MKVAYQVVFTETDETFDNLLSQELRRAFADEYKDVDDAEILDYYRLTYEQFLDTTDSDEDTSLIAFEIELPDDIGNLHRLLDNINRRLSGLSGVAVLIKFKDELLFSDLRELYIEISEIEMRLREAATLIFADTYKKDYFEHLRETQVKASKDLGINKNKEERLKSRWENEFFHILFSDYRSLAKPRDLKETDFLTIAGDSADFETFKQHILYRGIQKTQYKDFFASIERYMEDLEKVRNCVAHNRAPSIDELTRFREAKVALDKEIDNFFATL